ncbi:hypothetical protein LWI29_013351 [Acer saccharum]|uniref:Uncharacterized protein n=1 Tax=Acer saccharum TaxID=4024 RepID=A0AA39VZE6_ACESA|nr:hypothetical protein LWI29_013351 [Acer saccharum]
MLLYHERSTNIALRRATFRAPSRAKIYRNIAMSSYMSTVECQLLNSLRRATLLTPSQAKVLGTLQLPSQTTNYNNSELAYYRQIGIISLSIPVFLCAKKFRDKGDSGLFYPGDDVATLELLAQSGQSRETS